MRFTIKTTINAKPETIFNLWLSSEGHSKMTGGRASATDMLGGSFSAWDGYIEGRNLVLEPFHRIVQSWRTTEFKVSEPDSRLEILLKEVDGQTELTLIHTELPPHGAQYEVGWEDHYFKPMKAYFSNING